MTVAICGPTALPSVGKDAWQGSGAVLTPSPEDGTHSGPLPGQSSRDRIEFEVAFRHIWGGTRSHGQACAVALALRDAGYGLHPLGVNEYGVTLSDGCVYGTSAPLMDWIRAFDAGESVAPGRFRLYFAYQLRW